MSTTAELPSWPIISSVYREAWGVLKTNLNYLIAFFLIIFATHFLINFIFGSLVISNFHSTGLKESNSVFSISAAVSVIPILLPFIVILFQFYFQSVIYVYIIRGLFVPQDDFNTSIKTIFLNYRTLKLFGFQIAVFATLFLIIGLPIGAAIIAYYFDFNSAGFVLVAIAAIIFVWLMALTMQILIFPVYIAIDFPVFNNYRSIMKKTEWRFWKITFLLLVTNLPIIVIEVGANIFFMDNYFGNMNDVGYYIENSYFGSSMFLTLRQGLNLFFSALLNCQLIIEIFKRVEPYPTARA